MLENAYGIIIEELKPLFDEQGFKTEQADDGEVYKSDKKAIKIRFDDKKKMYRMYAADVTDGSTGEFAELSTWLFEDESDEKDARSIGADFKDTLEEVLGIKKAAFNAHRSQIDLPSKAAPGATPGIGAFTQRFLTICPQFKDAYKDNVAQYGDFLYYDFYCKIAAPHLRELLKRNDKKQLTKFCKMISEMYIDGDSEVDRVIVCCILGEAVYDDEELLSRLEGYLEGEDYLKHILRITISLIKKDKAKSARAKGSGKAVKIK